MRLDILVLALIESRVLRMINCLFTNGGIDVWEEVHLREVSFENSNNNNKKTTAALQINSSQVR